MLNKRKRQAEQREAIGIQTIVGLVEVVIGLATLLEVRGLITRAELARTFRLLVDQQRRKRDEIANQAAFEARCAAATTLAEFFELPVSDRPFVIAGGKLEPHHDPETSDTTA